MLHCEWLLLNSIYNRRSKYLRNWLSKFFRRYVHKWNPLAARLQYKWKKFQYEHSSNVFIMEHCHCFNFHCLQSLYSIDCSKK